MVDLNLVINILILPFFLGLNIIFSELISVWKQGVYVNTFLSALLSFLFSAVPFIFLFDSSGNSYFLILLLTFFLLRDVVFWVRNRSITIEKYETSLFIKLLDETLKNEGISYRKESGASEFSLSNKENVIYTFDNNDGRIEYTWNTEKEIQTIKLDCKKIKNKDWIYYLEQRLRDERTHFPSYLPTILQISAGVALIMFVCYQIIIKDIL